MWPVINFPKRQILVGSKMKDFTDNGFKFDENNRMFTKRVEKHCEKVGKSFI